MTFPTLASDFYGFEALLADHERDALVRLRTFLEAEPLVNDYWERAEFPRQILPGLHEQQVFGNLWEETKAGDFSAVYGGWTALEMARVDASVATYVGVQNGLAMGSIGVAGSPEQRAEWLQNANSFRDTAAVLRLTRAEVAWASVGTAIGAYEAAVEYATTREQFGKPIARHQLVQDLLSRSLANITASIALCTRVSQMLDDGVQRDEHASLAKAFATTAMRETVGLCREALGGNGIVLDYDVARFHADAEALYSYEGTREMNSLIVGRAITGMGAFV